MAISYKEFAKKIKEQKPSLSNINDYDLAQKFIEQNPEYESKIIFDTTPSVTPPTSNIQTGQPVNTMTQPTDQNYEYQNQYEDTEMQPIYKQTTKTPYGATGSFEKKPLYKLPTPQEQSETLKRRGIDVSPEIIAKGRPTQEFITQGSQEFINSALLNMPKAVLAKLGYKLPEPETTAGSIGATSGTIAGIVTPGGVSGAISRGVAGSKLLSKLPNIAKLGAAGAAEGLAWTPETTDNDLLAIDKRFKNAAISGAIGAALGSIGDVYTGVKNLFKNTDIIDEKLARTVRADMWMARKNASKKFGVMIDNLSKSNPDKKINVDDAINSLDILTEDDRVFKNLVNKSNRLKELIANPKELTLRESQDLINDLNSLMPKKFIKGDISSSQILTQDYIDSIRLKQLEAFPEMASVREDYSKFMKDFDLIKNKLKPGSTLLTLKRKFGEPEARQASKRILSERIQKPIDKYSQRESYKDITKKTGKSLATAGVIASGYGLIDKLRGKR